MTGFRSETPVVGGNAGQVVFFDDFLGSTLAPQWLALNRDGDQSNSELQWYLPANVTVTGGNLVETCQVQSQSGRSYTSGCVQWRSFNFRFGTVEARILYAGGLGPWPAMWLLGSDCQYENPINPGNIGGCNWPAPGSEEVDIAEIRSSDHLHVSQNVQSTGGNSINSVVATDVSTNWHVYKMTWTSAAVTWYIDGAQTASTTTAIPQRSMFMIIDLAVGGSGGAVTNGTLPQSTLVDYVKVTQG